MDRVSLRGGGVWRALDRVSRRTETPVALCIDVEPDDRVFDPANPPPWLGFERFVEQIPAVRERLSEATGKPARFTWFLRMDPQVAESWGSPTWAAGRYEDALAELTEYGDELALHAHTWRWDSQVGDWVADYRDHAWAEHCVTMGLDAFETAFGRKCTAHRAGDHHLTGAILSVLESRGVEVDLTVEPGLPALEGGTVRRPGEYVRTTAKSPGGHTARAPTSSPPPIRSPPLAPS